MEILSCQLELQSKSNTYIFDFRHTHNAAPNVYENKRSAYHHPLGESAENSTEMVSQELQELRLVLVSCYWQGLVSDSSSPYLSLHNCLSTHHSRQGSHRGGHKTPKIHLLLVKSFLFFFFSILSLVFHFSPYSRIPQRFVPCQ